MAVYQQRNEIIPTNAVAANNNQQGVYENMAAMPILASIKPPPNMGDTTKTYTNAEVAYLINNAK